MGTLLVQNFDDLDLFVGVYTERSGGCQKQTVTWKRNDCIQDGIISIKVDFAELSWEKKLQVLFLFSLQTNTHGIISVCVRALIIWPIQ